ncbi:MAG: tetratricopeptide repeat protein [Bacteroidetes bacterium]|nr:tetratricopeptide repeat protein [Bacteroidota bacterium]
MTKAATLIAVALLIAVGVARGQSLEEIQAKAIRGDAEAQFSLGVIYYRGMGVPQNFSLSTRWFRESADQGYALSQSFLSMCYFYGRGVKRDPTESYIWAILAKAGLSKIDDALTRELTLLSDDLIDALYQEMTIVQVKMAQDLALVRYNRIKARKAQN